MEEMKITWVPIESLHPYKNNAKKHPESQIANVTESIREFGWRQPVVARDDGEIVIGHCRVLAAERLGLDTVPVVSASDLTEEQIRKLRIVDNKTNESEWDVELLTAELQEIDLSEFDFDFKLPSGDEAVEDDFEINVPKKAKSKIGEIYQLGRHRLMCGDSTNADDVAKLMGGGVRGSASY